MASIYDFTALNNRGKEVSLADYKVSWLNWISKQQQI